MVRSPYNQAMEDLQVENHPEKHEFVRHSAIRKYIYHRKNQSKYLTKYVL